MKNVCRKKGRGLLFLPLIAAALLCASCTPVHNVRGNIVQDYQLSEVLTGQDTQTDVLRKLGSPTTKAPFDENVWYYIGQEMEKKANSIFFIIR